jgi:hypothetical protein
LPTTTDGEPKQTRGASDLDVYDGVSLISCHLVTNNFKSEIICQPFIKDWFVSLFTSCSVKQHKSSLKKLLRSVIIGGPMWYIHLNTYIITVVAEFLNASAIDSIPFPFGFTGFDYKSTESVNEEILLAASIRFTA